jgi:hypothetical protein
MKSAAQHHNVKTLTGQPIKPVRKIQITNACAIAGKHHDPGDKITVDPGVAIDLITAGKAKDITPKGKTMKADDPAVENRDPKPAAKPDKKK